MSIPTPGRAQSPGGDSHVQRVFSPDPRPSPVRTATGGCGCENNCACDQCNFKHADGKSAVDTKLTGS